MAGRGELALRAADEMAEFTSKSSTTYGEYVRSLRLLSLARMEEWGRVLAEPMPRGDKGVAAMWYEHSRGIAQARLGQVDAAQESLLRLLAVGERVRSESPGNTPRERNLRSMFDYAEASLQAQIAASRKSFDVAQAYQRKAMAAAAKVDSREPPLLADGTRLALGDIQARAARWSDSEATYREALAEHPGSGWALRGLQRALAAQGRAAEAAQTARELDASWAGASAHLRRPG